MSTPQLECFGVGDGRACGDRNHSAFLYAFEESAVLIDCGEPVSRSFKASGLSYETVDRIFLSHLHSDHFAGLFMLLQGFWLEQRKKDLGVHLPADGIQPLRQMLTAAYLVQDLLPFRLTFEPLQAGQTVAVGGVRVTPFRTSHLEGLRKSYQEKYPGDYAAYCFLLETVHRRVGHSADLGAPRDLEPLLAEPLDLLVCELDHFSAEDLFLYLKGCEIKHLVLTHLGRRYWEQLDATRKLAAQALPGVRISFPHDQTVIAF